MGGDSTEKEIAASLVLSPSTVHTHVVHVYEKAGLSTRAAAAMFAMRHDLLEEDEVA
jgi:DNA-binding NarL/FixJ family response regulator